MDSVSDPMLEIEAASSVISVLDVAQRFHRELKLLEIVVALHSVARHAEAAAFAVDVMQERASLVTGEGRKRCKGHLHYETSRSDASRMTICSFDTRSVA